MPGRHQSFHDLSAEMTANELEEIAERLEELIEYAEGEGYAAIAHKLYESLGPLSSALAAAQQYAIGELQRR